jgi:hypothetical protein
MAMIQCEKHGLSFVSLVCEHIIQAVECHQQCQRLQICLDEFFAPCVWVCKDCYKEYRNLEDIDLDHALDRLKLLCGKCFDEWNVTIPGVPNFRIFKKL